MKKLIAFPLTLILIFSCFSILLVGSVTASETEKSQTTEKTLVEFTPSLYSWSKEGEVVLEREESENYIVVDCNGTNKLITPVFELVPGKKYKLSFEIRLSGGGNNYMLDDKLFSPSISIFHATEFSENNSNMVMNYPVANDSVNNIYAFNNFRRENLQITWDVGGNKFTEIGETYFDSTDQMEISRIPNPENPKIPKYIDPREFYSSWTTVTATFIAVPTGENIGSQKAAVSFGSSFNYDGCELNLKNVKVSEIAQEKTTTIMQSDFANDFGKWYRPLEDDPTLNSSITIETEQDEAHVKIPSVNKNDRIISEPFDVNPYFKYEISFDICVPHNDSYYINNTNNGPIIGIYEMAKDPNTGEYDYNFEDNIYAINGDDFKRRENLSVSWEFEAENKPEALENHIFEGSTLFDNDDLQFIGSTSEATSVNNLFGDWTTVKITFVALPSAENSGAQTVAISFAPPFGYNKYANRYFNIKNVKVNETSYAYLTPEYDEENTVYYQAFDNLKSVTDAVNIFGEASSSNTALCDAVFQINPYTGNRYYSANAYGQNITIPLVDFDLNTVKLETYKRYNISFDWDLTKLLNTEGKVISSISSIALVGYSDDFVATKKIIKEIIPEPIYAMDSWQKFNVNILLTASELANVNAYKNYALVIKYGSEFEVAEVNNFRISLDEFHIKKLETFVGDYDLNGGVELADITLLAKYFAGWDTELDSSLADFNGDKTANLYDLVKIAQQVAGWK